MRVLLFGVAGGLIAAAMWRGLGAAFGQPVFLRENYRGAAVPTGVGIILPLAALAVEGVRSALEVAGVGQSLVAQRAQLLVLAAALGFGLLGLVDDVAGASGPKGFRGHLAAASRGHLTTGAVKMLGGGALALAVVAPFQGDRFLRLVVDASLVALAANLGNLLDRAPGRCIKVSLLAFALLFALTGDHVALWSPAVVVGAALALVRADLHEQLMLGDAGANALGAVVGLAVVMGTGPVTRLGVALVLLALNVASELVSFSAVIERVPVLRAIDQFGRRPRYGGSP